MSGSAILRALAVVFVAAMVQTVILSSVVIGGGACDVLLVVVVALAYGGAIYAENLNFRFGQGYWSALLHEHDTHLALVRTGFPTFNLLKLEPGWRLIYQDSLATLFGRPGLAIVEAIERTVPPALPPDGAGLCFP